MDGLLVMLKSDPHDHLVHQYRLLELESIAMAAGYKIRSKIVQTRSPHPKFLIGPGKLREIKSSLDSNTCVIFWNPLSSRQKHDLELELGTKVIDRAELILEIFEKNAITPEAKLQVKLAQLRKQFPYQRYLAKLRWIKEHPGWKGSGEYAYLRKLRELRSKIKRLEDSLERIRTQRSRLNPGSGFLKLALTGFFNAGKTTLFNKLTGNTEHTSPIPFTTLASKLGRFKWDPRIAVIDTIGLVQDLDQLKEILRSFRFTLEDVANADLVACVYDLSDPDPVLIRKYHQASQILDELGADPGKVINVLNKLDLLGPGQLESKLRLFPDGYPISALTGAGIQELCQGIVSRIKCR